MRVLGTFGLCLFVSGCITAHSQQQEREAQAVAQANSIFAECDAKIPKVKGQYVKLTNCKLAGLNVIRPLSPNPDLVDQEAALRMAVAEKVDAGKMTVAEAELAQTQGHSQIVAEEQRRNVTNRSADAQELAASRSFRCIRSGNTTNCY